MITKISFSRSNIQNGSLIKSASAILFTLLCAVSLISCGGSASSDLILDPLAPETDAPVAAAEDSGAQQFPAFPADRVASAQIALEFVGDDALETSSNARFEGSSVILSGSDTGIGYAMFEFVPGDNLPIALRPEVKYGTNASAYIALANFDSGRWESFGPFNSLKEINVGISGKPQYVSKSGAIYMAVITSGPYQLTVESVALDVEEVIVDDPNSWPSGAALAWINQWYIPQNMNGTYGIYSSREELAWAEQILALTNAERQAAGLAPVQLEPRLNALAQAHTRHFTATGFWSHTNPEGLDPWARLNAIDPPSYNEAGENMAAENESAQEVVSGWIASEGHRRNMLKPNVTHIGIGVVISPNGQFQTGATQILVELKEDPAGHNWIEPGEKP